MPNEPQRSPYPKSSDEVKGSQWEMAHRVHGSGDVGAIFGGKPTALTPWPSAGRTKSNPRGYDPARVEAAMANPGQHLRDMDPRNLHATQSHVTQEGVNYYMGDTYRQTGQTFRDMDQAGNRHPVVYTDRRGQNRLLSGHHRATAALLHGGQFRALHVEE